MIAALRHTFTPLCIATALVCLAPRCLAQTEEDRAAARSLATQGITAFNEGRHAVALDLFTRAESLLHAPPHMLYMARSAAKLGQLVRAREVYLKLVREELPASAPQAFRDAQTEARDEVQAIEPRLANLVINVKPPAGVEPGSIKLELDDKAISSAVLGVPIPADPGKHRITASAPGYQSRLVEVSLAEGGRGTAEVVLEPSTVTEPATGAPSAPTAGTATLTSTPPAPDSTTTSGSGSPAWMRPVSYVAMGVGVLGLGAGTYFGLKSRGTRKDADNLANQCESPCLNSDPLVSEIGAKDDDARRQMTISIVGFIVGGVGAVTGVTLFALSGRRSPQSAQVVAPYVGWGAAGLHGTW